MTAALLALCLLAEPIDLDVPAEPAPRLLVGKGGVAHDVTGRVYHGPTGMGIRPGIVHVEAKNGSAVRWWVRDRRGWNVYDWQEAGRWLTLHSWMSDRLEVRALVQTLQGRTYLSTVILFDGPPF